MRVVFFCILCLFSISLSAQNFSPAQKTAAKRWADSVYKTLSNDEKIAQLMVVRLSTIDSKTKHVTFYDKEVMALVNKYNVGGICVFQGSPVKQAEIINNLQAAAKTPIMMCIDAEWGVGMRLIDSVLPLPKQMMLGAMKDQSIVYKYGQVVADQCKRIGLHVNYAPVVDVNNNPNNPVINDRSFGENKIKVADFGTAYMKGMQDKGVMACAKHFPGHGDVDVDSHYDLPVINKTRAQLEALELYPFRKIFEAGVGSAMIAHLYIPAIDKTANRATSLSPQNINGLLRKELGYQGLTFTDALEMQGVAKFFPSGEASVQSLIAGNDMLCLPGDVPESISRINEAINQKRLSWKDIELHCKKVLESKYLYVLPNVQPIPTENLTADLNRDVPAMTRLIAENAITLVSKKDQDFFPFNSFANNKQMDVAYVGIGLQGPNSFAQRIITDYNAASFYFDSKQDKSSAEKIIDQAKKYKKLVIGIHSTSRSPANNFGLTPAMIELVKKLGDKTDAIIFLFANAYASKNWCDANNLVVCYEDNQFIHETAADMLQGKIPYKGSLPVTVCSKFKSGTGIQTAALDNNGLNQFRLGKIDSIANDAITKNATPGCVVMVVKDGKIAYEKAFGAYTSDMSSEVTASSVYDMASVTKICATTIAVMKLYDEGKLDLKKKLSHYLPWVEGTDKADLVIEKILLHEAGLVAYIPFYKETIDSNGDPLPGFYRHTALDSFNIRVANNLYLRNDWTDSIYTRILRSPLAPGGKYIYSDNDFIFLGKIVEAITGQTLDQYVARQFYNPMCLSSIGFRPLTRLPSKYIVPTEEEKIFRKQLLKGDVHDPGAAMFGGVAGHAGLFSNAYDIASVMQMLLNGGVYNGRRYLLESTVRLFTGYHSNISRRGYGFDKPEKDNDSKKEPYPTKSASAATFGHTGFTGTCAWADPEKNIVFVFLSNRVHPSGSNLLLNMNVRSRIHETIYSSLVPN